jgi:hypothetical protein
MYIPKHFLVATKRHTVINGNDRRGMANRDTIQQISASLKLFARKVICGYLFEILLSFYVAI